MRYDTPYRRGLRAGFYDKDGYFNGIWASLLVYLFNTKQVTAHRRRNQSTISCNPNGKKS